MSAADVELVRRSFDAWNEGDIRAIRSFYADDVVIETPITEFGTTFAGDDPLRDWIAEQRETWAETRWQVDRIFEGDGVVVAFYRSISVGRNSGAAVARDLTGLHVIHNGKIARERVFLDRDEALKGAGVTSPSYLQLWTAMKYGPRWWPLGSKIIDEWPAQVSRSSAETSRS